MCPRDVPRGAIRSEHFAHNDQCLYGSLMSMRRLVSWSVVSGHCFLAGLAVAQTGVPKTLGGLWAFEAVLGPAARGPVVLRQLVGGYSAQVGGFEAAGSRRGYSIRFELTGHQGAFRGTFRGSSAAVEGFWVQPSGLVSGVPYASPLTLLRIAPGVWRGELAPLADRYDLYLSIARDSGGWYAAFRNPQRNDRGGSSRFLIRARGDSIRFIGSADSTRTILARYDSTRGVISVAWDAIGLTLEMTRRDSAAGAGYFARLATTGYVYRAPAPQSDGWRSSAARETGMDEQALTNLVRRLTSVDPSIPSAPLIHSISIAHHGRLVLDEYFFGFDADRTHDLRSGGKTFASVLAGAVRARGVTLDLDAPVLPLFRSSGPVANPDARKSRITLRHLMTMTSGLACDENDDASPGNEGTMQSQSAQADWYKFTLDLPMAHDPGTNYAYCSAGANLIGGVLGATTHRWLPELFDDLVARPLGIRRYYTNLTPTGEMYFGGGTRMRPRDFLKFGQLYLDGGVWNGQRIVPADWVRQSTTAYPSGLANADGLNWHLYQLKSGDRTYREYEANGNGGQFLIVVPELDLAVVFTAGNYGMYGVWRKFRDEIVPQMILPAVVRGTSR